MLKLIGPFSQLLTMDRLPGAGPIEDDRMEVIADAGIVVRENTVVKTGRYFDLLRSEKDVEPETIEEKMVALPGFIDVHTHMCFAGSRSAEYSMRLAGENYTAILAKGGGILNTVESTRNASYTGLKETLLERALRHFRDGITTMEVKSGYGLNKREELRMLKAINDSNEESPADLVPTCLAAHVIPPEFTDEKQYLDYLVEEVMPEIIKLKLCSRIDIFIEKEAFSPDASRVYLRKAKAMGFDITIHADQFTTGGSEVACDVGALSADHLEASGEKELKMLAASGTAAVVLPGSTMGLGMPFAPARKILDTGCTLAIATDWNPGSAPMGDLLLQAAVISASEKLSNAETLAAVTCRAAVALGIKDKGVLCPGGKADIIAFHTDDFREILYHQGKLKPSVVWKDAQILKM